MSTTERKPIRTRQIPLLTIAATGIAILYWLHGPLAEKPSAPPPDGAATSNPHTSSVPAAAATPAATGGVSSRPASAAGNVPAPLLAVEADIPAYGSPPADVIVEIGAPIDADNPPLETLTVSGPVTNLGPPLDADDPFSTVQNSSTESIAIGDEMPTDAGSR